MKLRGSARKTAFSPQPSPPSAVAKAMADKEDERRSYQALRTDLKIGHF